MFFLTYGESGPRVVLIQALLRLKGINLRITGKWDEANMRAVEKYRAQLHLPPMGPVDAQVFFNLIQKTHLKLVDSVDGSAGLVRVVAEQDMKEAGIKPLVNPRLPGRGVSAAIDKIIARSQHHKIALLRITGHGNRGTWISVAVGDPVEAQVEGRIKDYQAMKADWKSYIDFSHFERLRPILSRLRPLFASFGSAEVHCCKIGNQKTLLQKLAETWGVPVSGGLANHQVGGYDTNQYGEYVPSTFAFQGEVFTAYPGGKNLKSWAAGIDASIPNLPEMASQIQHVFPTVFGKK
jgi:hypothetical protein